MHVYGSCLSFGLCGRVMSSEMAAAVCLCAPRRHQGHAPGHPGWVCWWIGRTTLRSSRNHQGYHAALWVFFGRPDVAHSAHSACAEPGA